MKHKLLHLLCYVHYFQNKFTLPRKTNAFQLLNLMAVLTILQHLTSLLPNLQHYIHLIKVLVFLPYVFQVILFLCVWQDQCSDVFLHPLRKLLLFFFLIFNNMFYSFFLYLSRILHGSLLYLNFLPCSSVTFDQIQWYFFLLVISFYYCCWCYLLRCVITLICQLY